MSGCGIWVFAFGFGDISNSISFLPLILQDDRKLPLRVELLFGTPLKVFLNLYVGIWIDGYLTY